MNDVWNKPVLLNGLPSYHFHINLFLGSSISGFNAAIETEIFQKPGETMKVAVPAILYVVQNNLLFLALSNLDAATYQVGYKGQGSAWGGVRGAPPPPAGRRTPSPRIFWVNNVVFVP